MTIASFSCTILTGTNKVGDLVMDAKGYRKVTLGAFGMANEQGTHYHMTDKVRALFGPGTDLRRRLDRGLCRGEWEHPARGNMTLPEYVSRLRAIRMDCVSHHIRKMDLEASKDEHGKDIILVSGWVLGSGKQAAVFDAMMKNREENVAFSLRSFSNPIIKDGIVGKEVKALVGYDLVNEGGKRLATKFDTPSLESFYKDIDVTGEMLDMIDANEQSNILDLESDGGVSTVMIRDSLGLWANVELVGAHTLDWR